MRYNTTLIPFQYEFILTSITQLIPKQDLQYHVINYTLTVYNNVPKRYTLTLYMLHKHTQIPSVGTLCEIALVLDWMNISLERI